MPHSFDFDLFEQTGDGPLRGLRVGSRDGVELSWIALRWVCWPACPSMWFERMGNWLPHEWLPPFHPHRSRTCTQSRERGYCSHRGSTAFHRGSDRLCHPWCWTQWQVASSWEYAQYGMSSMKPYQTHDSAHDNKNDKLQDQKRKGNCGSFMLCLYGRSYIRRVSLCHCTRTTYVTPYLHERRQNQYKQSEKTRSGMVHTKSFMMVYVIYNYYTYIIQRGFYCISAVVGTADATILC